MGRGIELQQELSSKNESEPLAESGARDDTVDNLGTGAMAGSRSPFERDRAAETRLSSL